MQEAGLGHISEICEGDAPHRPCGCIAQAWSVAEVLRAYVEDLKGIKPRAEDHRRVTDNSRVPRSRKVQLLPAPLAS
jgi:glycogen debranching enzyme